VEQLLGQLGKDGAGGVDRRSLPQQQPVHLNATLRIVPAKNGVRTTVRTTVEAKTAEKWATCETFAFLEACSAHHAPHGLDAPLLKEVTAQTWYARTLRPLLPHNEPERLLQAL
jgi:hypothetical protein